MYAIEFETVANGNIIYIPENHREFDSHNVKVILMMDSGGKAKKERVPGSAKGKIFLSEDFESPLDEETANLFYQ